MLIYGRGAWRSTGMPNQQTKYYEYIPPGLTGSTPKAGPDYEAVTYGVKAIKHRINELGYKPKLPEDGIFGPRMKDGLIWAQNKIGVVPDGICGPKTALALFWPIVKEVEPNNLLIQHTVGGIATHESAWDPGAVGYTTPDDHGMVQINKPANPKITLAQAFDPRFAFSYARDRITQAFNTYHDIDIAVCSYASPLWAQQWAQLGHAPNQQMLDYANYVRNWNAPA